MASMTPLAWRAAEYVRAQPGPVTTHEIAAVLSISTKRAAAGLITARRRGYCDKTADGHRWCAGPITPNSAEDREASSRRRQERITAWRAARTG